MLQEYYFDKKYKEKFIECLDDEFKQIVIFDNISNKIKATINVEGNNKYLAKKLHLLHDKVEKLLKKYHYYDEAHIYICNKLFPYAAKIEEKLKAIVLLAFCKAEENLSYKKLRGQKLYDYFALLIFDKDFNNKAKNLFHSKKMYTKQQLINKLQEIDENPIYQEANLPLEDSSIIEKFQTVKDWRNDIMHFNYFTYDEYNTSISLFKEYIDDLEKLYRRLSDPKRQEGLVPIIKINADVIAETLERCNKSALAAAEAIEKPLKLYSDIMPTALLKSIYSQLSGLSHLSLWRGDDIDDLNNDEEGSAKDTEDHEPGKDIDDEDNNRDLIE